MRPDATTRPVVLLVGLELGFYAKEDVVGWADLKIEATDTPSDELIQLSMSGSQNVHELLSLLRRTIGSRQKRQETELAFAFLHELYTRKRIELGNATRAIYSLLHEGELTDQEEWMAYHLDDGYQLALNGTFGTVEEIESDFLEFTRPFWDKLLRDHDATG